MGSGTVYVIGAGFSRGVGIPASKELVSDKEFKYLKEKLKDNSNFVSKIQNLQSYVQYRIENRYCEKNVESVLNHLATAKYLDMESMTEKSNYSADDIFDDLLWYIARIIREKISDINNKIPDEYNSFLHSVYDNGESIITFNYDILLETILVSMGHGYRYGIDEQRNENEQLILKLHGSLNWGKCKKCGPVDVYQNILTFEKDSKVSCPICKHDIISPLLVPPVIYKDSYYNDQFFGPLVRESWSLANEVLSQAKRIVFIGFSMAKDAYAEELFKLSLNMNPHDDLKCLVVNRTCDDELKARYESVLANEEYDFVESDFINYVKNNMK